MGSRAVAACMLAGCYAPNAQPGGQCSPSGACPSDLSCIDGVCIHPGPVDALAHDGNARDAAFDAVDAPPKFAIRIDVAGPAHVGVDYPGAWLADPGAGGICDGSQFDSPTPTINGTNDSTLFVNQMFGTTLACAIPNVPAGTYKVTLLYAELRLGGTPCMAGTAHRVFDIAIEGATVRSGLDMTSFGGGCAASGGTGHAFDLSFTAAIQDGTFDLVETASMGAAAVNAIELVQQ